MDDVIRERGHNVPELMRIEILVKGGEVINKGKTSNIVLFYAAKINKIIQWSPLWIIFKGKIKIAHLLME